MGPLLKAMSLLRKMENSHPGAIVTKSPIRQTSGHLNKLTELTERRPKICRTMCNSPVLFTDTSSEPVTHSKGEHHVHIPSCKLKPSLSRSW